MRSWFCMLLAFIAFLALPTSASAQEVETSEAFLLVATGALNNSNYRQSVILSIPVDGDRHIGIILNRPTRRTLGELFPSHEPSKKVAEPVFLGGPMQQRVIFALVRGTENPGRGSIRVADDLFLAMTENAVDRIIEQRPDQARFFMGDVLWRPGELREEIGDSYWHVLSVDLDLLFRKDTRALWDELSQYARAPRAVLQTGSMLALHQD